MFGGGPAQMVIISGVHPCEDHGTQVMQAFVESLLASPAILARYTVMVYPCVNPQGLIEGQPHTVRDLGPLPAGWSDTPPEPTVEEKLAAIEANYAPQFAALDAALLNALWADGEEAKRAELAQKRGTLYAKMNEEMSNVLIGG